MAKRIAVLLAGWAIAGAAVIAQTPAPQKPAVFRSGVDLVTVGVTVVDRDGRPVKGLTAEDFVVSLDGKRGQVRALEFLEFGATPAPRADTPTRTPGGAPAAPPSRGGRVILIVVDDLSARPSQMANLRVAAQRMLATLDLGDLVGVATTSGLGPAISPTRDRAAVLAALSSKTIVGRYDDDQSPYYVTIPEAIEINDKVAFSFAPDRGYENDIMTKFADVVRRECFDLVAAPDVRGADDASCATRVITTAAQLGKSVVRRAAAQLSAYKQLIEALAPAPAPRVIIALSQGIAVGLDHTAYADLDPIGAAAAKAGVQLYALTEPSEMADAGEKAFLRAAARRDEQTFLASGVQTVAHAAGGEAFMVIGQADRFFTRIASETSGIYQLGVESSATPAGEFVDVKVSVNRPGAIVRMKARALASAAVPPPASIDAQLQQRLAQGGAAVGVPISLATLLRRNPLYGDRLQLGVNIQVPATITGPVVAMFAVINAEGRVVESGRAPLPVPAAGQDYEASLPVSLPAGDYRIRVAAADAAGSIGSIEEPFKAALTRYGTNRVSSVFASWSGADGALHPVVKEAVPESAKSLRVTLELYPDNADAPADVSVRLAVIEEGGIDPIVELDAPPTGSGATRIVAASLPIDRLGAGAYTIRATVMSAAGDALGTVKTVIRKQ